MKTTPERYTALTKRSIQYPSVLLNSNRGESRIGGAKMTIKCRNRNTWTITLHIFPKIVTLLGCSTASSLVDCLFFLGVTFSSSCRLTLKGRKVKMPVAMSGFLNVLAKTKGFLWNCCLNYCEESLKKERRLVLSRENMLIDWINGTPE